MVWFWPDYANELEDDKRETGDTADDNEEEVDDEISNGEKLKAVTSYLRSTHFYCVWCGVKYEGNNKT